MLEKNITLEFEDSVKLMELYGEREQNLRTIESEFKIQIHSRVNNLRLIGLREGVEKADLLISKLSNYIKNSTKKLEINSLIKILSTVELEFNENDKKDFIIQTRKKSVIPFNKSQLEYINLIQNKEIVFASGPAGTGKTYLAVAMGVSFFLTRKVEKIVLSRPAVEAGERIGFLPGNIQEKIDPYLRPLYDALYEMLETEFLNKCIEEGKIEIAPLAFMRGRSLNNAYVILDEAQNTTINQMKMFLTRLGTNSHMVISGDPLQTDLPKAFTSGMSDAINRLFNIKEIGFKNFSQNDIIRNKLISKIIEAYETN